MSYNLYLIFISIIYFSSIFSDIFINYLIERTNRSLMYKSNVQRRMISLPEGKTLEDDLMFDSDCLAILLTALAADVCRERESCGWPAHAGVGCTQSSGRNGGQFSITFRIQERNSEILV